MQNTIFNRALIFCNCSIFFMKNTAVWQKHPLFHLHLLAGVTGNI